MQEPKKSSGIGPALVMITQIGITVLAPTLLLLFLGVWLDNQFQTWFAIPLMLLGLAGGCRCAWAMVKGMDHTPSTPKREQYDLMQGWYEEKEVPKTKDSLQGNENLCGNVNSKGTSGSDSEDGCVDEDDEPMEGEPHG